MGKGRSRQSRRESFPLGKRFDQDKANNNSVIGNTSTVGCFPKGKSLYEVQDMSGNVWEWTRSEYKNYLFNPKEKLEKAKDTNILRVLRGGAFSSIGRLVRCAARTHKTRTTGSTTRVSCGGVPIFLNSIL